MALAELSPQGWECPKCGHVYAPSVASCFNCPSAQIAITVTITAKPAVDVGREIVRYLNEYRNRGGRWSA